MWTPSIAVTHKKVMFVINTYVLALSMPETVVIVAADKLHAGPSGRPHSNAP